MTKAGPHIEPNWAVRTCAVLLTAFVATYGFMGWAKGEQWLFALLCVVIQALANNASAQARRARAKGLWFSFVFMMAAMVGCALFSAISLDHAFSSDGLGASLSLFDLGRATQDPMFWFFVFLALLEPAFYWAVEAIEREPYPVSESDLADQALAQVRAGAPGREPEMGRGLVHGSPVEPRRDHLRIVGGSVLAAAVSMGGPITEPTPIVSTNTGYADQRAHALALHRSDPSRTHISIAQEVRTARSNVTRWIAASRAA